MQTVAAAGADQNDDVNRPQAPPVHYTADVPFFKASHILAKQTTQLPELF